MKKIMLTAAAVAAFATTNYAQTAAQVQEAPAVAGVAAAAPQAPAVQAAPEKTQIAKANLPQPILQLLATDAYKDQAFEDAWLVKGEPEVYIVNLKKGDAKTQLKLNKEGKEVS